MAKTRKTITKKKIKKSAIETMLDENTVEQEQPVNSDMNIPADSKEDIEVAMLRAENEDLLVKVSKLQNENKKLNEDLKAEKEKINNLSDLFESYEIEFLRMENDSLKHEIETLKRQLGRFAPPTVKYPQGTRLANAHGPVMAPTNGYESW